MSECNCNCNCDDMAPFWHSDNCPIQSIACNSCDGKGYFIVTLGCGCCSDTERCDDCNGSGIESQD